MSAWLAWGAALLSTTAALAEVLGNWSPSLYSRAHKVRCWLAYALVPLGLAGVYCLIASLVVMGRA